MHDTTESEESGRPNRGTVIRDATSFLDVRRDMLRFSTLPHLPRVLVVSTLALALVGLMSQALDGPPIGAPVILPTRDGEELGVFSATVIVALLLVGRTYVMAAAMRARWWAGAPLLFVSTVTFFLAEPLYGVSAVRTVLAGDLLVLWGYFAARHVRFRSVPLAVDFAVSAVAGLALDLGVPLTLAAGGAIESWFPTAIELIFAQVLALFMAFGVPLLCVVGVDLTLLGLEGAAWLTGRVARRVPVDVLTVALLVFAVAKAAYHLLTDVPEVGGTLIALAAILAAAGASYRLRHVRWGLEEPPVSWLLVLAALVVGWAFIPIMLTNVFGMVRLGFTLSWALGALCALGLGVLGLAAARRGARWGQGFGWLLLVFGTWQLLTSGNVLALVGLVTGSRDTSSSLLHAADMHLAVALAGAAGGAGLLLTRTASRGAFVAIGAPLLGFSAIMELEFLFRPRELGGIAASSLLAGLSLSDLLALAQIALFMTLPLALAWQAIIRRRGTLPGVRSWRGARPILLAGLLVVALVVLIAAGLLPLQLKPAERLIGLAILIVGLTWDILLSGKRFTNGDSSSFPRVGRVLLYLGSVTFASGFLIYMYAVRNLDLVARYEFYLSFPMVALLFVGLPVAIFLWIMRGGVAWTGETEP